MIRMLYFNVLIQTTLGSITFGTVLNGAFIVSCDLGGSPPVTLFLLVVDFEWHAEHLFVVSLIVLHTKRKVNNQQNNNSLDLSKSADGPEKSIQFKVVEIIQIVL